MISETRLVIRRDWNVRDNAGNGYGILDVNPDPSDPAVLLGIYVTATAERVAKIVRAGSVVEAPGIDLTVESLTMGDRPQLVLVGTIDAP